MAIELRRSSEFSVADLATIFTAAFDDYLIPFEMDEARLGYMVDAYDLDLTRSLVAVANGAPIGLGNLGLRPGRAWLGGAGVLPAHRRLGHGDALTRGLLDQARAAGARELALEVLVDNAPAIALYEKLGFRRTRELEVLSLAVDAGGSPARRSPTHELSCDEALRRIAAKRDTPEPWQRDDATVASLRQRSPVTAMAADGGAALFREELGSIDLLQAAGGPTELEGLVTAMRSRGKVRALNIPADGGVSAALRAAGAEVVARQYEMRAAL